MKFPTLIVFFLLLVAYLIPSVSAQTCTTDTRVTNGLITTPSVTGKFGVDLTGKCITSNETSFAPFKIPSYDDLKSLYFTQKTGGLLVSKDEASENDIPLNSDSVYNTTGNLTISSNIPGNKTGVIFVEGNLILSPASQKLTTNDSAGLVFVVKGNVNINKDVSQIDAVIISSGIIRTAGSTCTTSAETASALTINGSLVSLDSTKPPVFCRTLGSNDNTQPAEKIVQQPKYLVILKDLFSDTLQKWSEIQ
ncbi:hypothetical protein HYT74_02570 [Candidatus Daviesbacteria bacterium]|nr:hypothetical protein [Candidatus Daviesbacteria bacterium]